MSNHQGTFSGLAREGVARFTDNPQDETSSSVVGQQWQSKKRKEKKEEDRKKNQTNRPSWSQYAALPRRHYKRRKPPLRTRLLSHSRASSCGPL